MGSRFRDGEYTFLSVWNFDEVFERVPLIIVPASRDLLETDVTIHLEFLLYQATM